MPYSGLQSRGIHEQINSIGSTLKNRETINFHTSFTLKSNRPHFYSKYISN